jgi:hypothetical protein
MGCPCSRKVNTDLNEWEECAWLRPPGGFAPPVAEALEATGGSKPPQKQRPYFRRAFTSTECEVFSSKAGSGGGLPLPRSHRPRPHYFTSVLATWLQGPMPFVPIPATRKYETCPLGRPVTFALERVLTATNCQAFSSLGSPAVHWMW